MGAASKDAGRVVFVYYKIDPLERTAFVVIAQRFFRVLKDRWPDLAIELMRREEQAGDVETWMEIFRCPAGISAEMMLDISQKAEVFKMPGHRICEVFIEARVSEAE